VSNINQNNIVYLKISGLNKLKNLPSCITNKILASFILGILGTQNFMN